MRIPRTLVAVLTACLPACGPADDSAQVAARVGPMTIRLESPSFREGDLIPRAHTCDGEDISPSLSWENVPEGAHSLLLIVEDPDAPMGTWTHWLLYDLPAALRGLPEGLPHDPRVHFVFDKIEFTAKQGRNDFKKPGYGGPCPPSGTHRYYFRIYALDSMTNLEPNASRQEVFQAIQGHILAEGQLMGQYSRGG